MSTTDTPDGEAGSIASSIDLVSNAVIISGVDISQAGYLMQPHKYPDRFMPALLHEASHWDTFNTPVGNSLAYVFVRAWQRSIAAENDDLELHDKNIESADHEYEAVLDYSRYHIISELLRPLCEGIALFTEFNLVPGSSKVTTTSTLLAGMLFGGWPQEFVAKRRVVDLCNINLKKARRHAIYQARKENLLCQPFTTEEGGYFPGYFFLKLIHNYLITKRGLFNLVDGDLFITIVKSVIFGDLELARLIIDPELDMMGSTEPEALKKDAINAPLIRIQQLLEYLIHDLDQSYIENIEKIVGGKQRWSWLQLQTVEDKARILENITLISKNFDWAERFENESLGDDKHTSTIKKLIELSKNLFTTRSSEESIIKYYEFPRGETERLCLDLLYNRKLLCLASFKTYIKILPNGTCWVGQLSVGDMIFPYISLQALPGIEPQEGNGSYEIYLPRNFGDEAICFSVVIDDRCVACGSLNPSKNFDQTEFAKRKPSLAKTADLRSKMNHKLDELCVENPIWEHYSSQTLPLIRQMYIEHAAHMYSEMYNGELNGLIDRSLFEATGEDSKFISDYVAISLVEPNIITKESLIDTCKELNIDYREFMNKMNELKHEKNIPLYEEIGEIICLLL